MSFLADTNILLRFFRTADPEHPLVRMAVTALLARGETLHSTQQNRRELWSVCTRPAGVNGFGLTVPETLAAVELVDATFTRLPDVAPSGPEWDRIVIQHQVVGRAVHDAQLIACMIVHGITHIRTLNVPDFARYGEVTVVHPGEVIAPSAPPVEEAQ
jgi:predicted nucleic acid-binding protein